MVKKQKSIGIKSSYSNTSYGFDYKKTAWIKRKVEQERPMLTECCWL